MGGGDLRQHVHELHPLLAGQLLAKQRQQRIGDADKIAERTKEYEDRFLSPFVAAERGYIDEVIMPHSTRKRIARALGMLRTKEMEQPWKKHDNIPL